MGASMVAQKRICLQCKKPGFCPSAEKIPWRREWLPTPVFLPREFHGLAGLQSMRLQRVRRDLASNTFTFHFNH